MKMAIFALCLCFLGCSTEETKQNDKATGELRHKLFVECMGLAAKMPRQADDDVSDVVEECSDQSYYMANHMTK